MSRAITYTRIFAAVSGREGSPATQSQFGRIFSISS